MNKDFTNRINFTGALSVTINDIEYLAIVRDGDWNGSEIIEFDEGAVYKEPEQYSHTFQLDKERLKLLSSHAKKIIHAVFKAKYDEI